MRKMKSGRLKKAFYSSVTAAIDQLAVIVCGFITSRIIVQYYGSSWNGILSAITKFLSLFVVVEAGINGSTRVALYHSLAANDREKTSGIIRANDLFYRKISILLLAYIGVLMIVLPNMVQSDKTRMQIVLMIGIASISKFAENCWGINSRILLAASQNSYIINLAKTVSTVVNALLLVLVVSLGSSIFIAKATSNLIFASVPIFLFVISRRMFHIDKNAEPDDSALKGRWDVIANSISNIVHENVDIFFLTMLCDAKEISVYSIYYVVAGGLTQVFKVITNGLEAGFGNMWAKRELDTLNSNLCRLEYIMYSLAVLLFGCMISVIIPFMGVYMSRITDVNYQRFALGMVIGIAEILRSLRTPYVLLVQAAGHYKQVKVGAYAEAVINIVLTAVLVWRYGIIGAIVGTIVANAFRTIQYGWYASRHMINRKFSMIIKRVLWAAVVLVVSVILSIGFQTLLPVTGWISWGVTAAIAFIIHAAVILVASFLFYKEDLYSSLKMIKRVVQ